MSNQDAPKPLVYSCSGCSSAAQLANAVAVRLDRSGIAEMSCIAGVGGDVPALVKVAKSGRRIAVLDGCPLQCANSCLERHGVVPDWRVVLSELGIKRVQHGDYDAAQSAAVFDHVSALLAG